MSPRAIALTAAALVAFAANSLLCRLALGARSIDPWSFTAVRIAAGALMVTLVAASQRSVTGASTVRTAGSWKDAVWLALYALPFSIAYTRLDTGTGALLLFGAVQLTLIAWAIRRGERPTGLELLGLAGAAAGLVYFVAPGVTAPDPWGAAAMIVAGVAWGFYTIAGKRAGNPVARTAGNFARATVIVVPLALLAFSRSKLSLTGVVLATTSGTVTSGLGYVAWYAALRDLSATRAALLQLLVPLLAAAAGILVLAEPLTARLVIASIVVLGSLALALSRARTGP